MHECRLYEPYKGRKDAVRCTACAHRCIIADGKRGLCAVRENKGGKLYLLVYGKVAAMHIDPMEKKPLFHFLPGSDVFSIGTVGCNFRCAFCQNWEISQQPKPDLPVIGQDITVRELVERAIESGCKSIAYTYNEPAVFVEFAHDVAKLARQRGLRNVYVTSGYETEEALDYMSPYIDAMNIDLKGFTDDFYLKTCGARLQPVLETIKRAKAMGVWIEITTLVIPGKNDSEYVLRGIAQFIASIDKGIPWHISRFFPMYKLLDSSPTSMDSLLRAYDAGKEAGLKYIYIGNIADESYERTLCPGCNELLIDRAWHQDRLKNNLKEDSCPKCRTKIPGVFR